MKASARTERQNQRFQAALSELFARSLTGLEQSALEALAWGLDGLRATAPRRFKPMIGVAYFAAQSELERRHWQAGQ